MFDVISEIVYEVTGFRDLTLDTDFVRDLSLNSFDVVSIVSAFEQRFGIEIPIREIWNLNQVRDVLRYLESKGVSA